MGFGVSDEFLVNCRLHSQKDEDEKNLVSKRTVVKGVLLHQTIQAIVAILLFKVTGNVDEASSDPIPWLVILAQFCTGMLVLDTWQCFIHRYMMHRKKFLYKHVHAQHHRLVVPYAFGALYNHPLEGLLLDTVQQGLIVPNLGHVSSSLHLVCHH